MLDPGMHGLSLLALLGVELVSPHGADEPRAQITVTAAAPEQTAGIHVEIRCARWAAGASPQPPQRLVTDDLGQIVLPLDMATIRLERWRDCEVVEGEIMEPNLVGGPAQVDLTHEELEPRAKPVYAVDYDLLLDAEPGAPVAIRVKGPHGRPLDAQVQVGEGPVAAVVAGEGHLGAPQRASSLRVLAKGFAPKVVPIHVIAGQPQALEVQLEPARRPPGAGPPLQVIPSDGMLIASAALGEPAQISPPDAGAAAHRADVTGVVIGSRRHPLTAEMRVVALCRQELAWAAVGRDGRFSLAALPEGSCILAAALPSTAGPRGGLELVARTRAVAPGSVRLQLP